MNRHRGAKGHEIAGIRIGRGAVVLEINLHLRDVIVLLVRQRGQAEFLAQRHAVCQRALKLHSALPRHD